MEVRDRVLGGVLNPAAVEILNPVLSAQLGLKKLHRGDSVQRQPRGHSKAREGSGAVRRRPGRSVAKKSSASGKRSPK